MAPEPLVGIGAGRRWRVPAGSFDVADGRSSARVVDMHLLPALAGQRKLLGL